jgi:CRISPR-associated protein Csx17
MPVAYGVLKPFFASASLLRYLGRLTEDAHWVLPQEIPRLLASGKVQHALAIAWRRSRIAGLGWPLGTCPKTAEADGPRLLAALVVPLQTAELAHLLPRVEDQDPEVVQL